MNKLPFLVLLVLGVCLASCDRSSKEKEAAKGDQAGKTPAPSAFERSEYHTRDGNSSMTFISETQLEFRTPDGKTAVCRYTEQDSEVHVFISNQSDREIICQRGTGSLTLNDGTVYGTQRYYDDEATQPGREHEVQLADQRRRAEEAHVDERVQESKTEPTKDIGTFSAEVIGEGATTVTVTDKSLKLTPAKGLSNGETARVIWFADIERVDDALKPNFAVRVQSGTGASFVFKNDEKSSAAQKCEAALATIKAARMNWRQTYAEGDRARRSRGHDLDL